MITQIQKQALNRAEAAKYLGVAQNTLVKLVENGKLRVIEVGRRKLYPIVALDEFLKGA